MLKRTIIAIMISSLVAPAFAVQTQDEEIPATLKLAFDKKFNKDAIVYKRNGSYYVDSATAKEILRDLNIDKPLSQEYFDISEIGQLEFENEYEAFINVKPELMPEQNFGLKNRKYRIAPEGEKNIYLTYDFNYSKNEQKSALITTLSPNITFEDGSYAKMTYVKNTDEKSFSGISSALYSKNFEFGRLNIGRSTSIANNDGFGFYGIQLKSNKKERVDYSPYATTQINGTIKTYGVADLFINGSQVSSQEVRPGDFTFSGVYNNITSSGLATLVIRNESGVLEKISVPLLSNPMNMQKGEFDYSLDLGKSGADLKQLGTTFASGNISYGLTDKITVDFAARKTSENLTYTLGSVIGTDFGTFKTSITNQSNGGNVSKLGYFYRQKTHGIAIEHTRFNDFESLKSTDLENNKSTTVTAYYSLKNGQPLNLTYTKNNYGHYASIGTSFPLKKNARLSTNVFHTKEKGFGLFVGFDMAFGDKIVKSQFDSQQSAISSTLTKTNGYVGEIDYSLNHRYVNNTNILVAEGRYNAREYLARGLVTSNADFNASISGSVLSHKSNIMFTRPINDAVLIIEGKKDVELYNHSEQKGKLNSNGYLAIPTSSLSDQVLFVNPESGPHNISIDNTRYEYNVKPNSRKTIVLDISEY